MVGTRPSQTQNIGKVPHLIRVSLVVSNLPIVKARYLEHHYTKPFSKNGRNQLAHELIMLTFFRKDFSANPLIKTVMVKFFVAKRKFLSKIVSKKITKGRVHIKEQVYSVE